jgi:hypothetical protein
MNRADMQTNIALALGTTEGGALSTAQLNRAISMAVAEMSRYIPQQLVEELQFELDVTSESFTSSSNNEVALANKPIKKDSETVTNAAATVTYTADTDYEIDWINGRIKTLSTGSISNSTSTLITYQKMQVGFNVGSLMTTPLKILAVEYPINLVPQSWCSFEWHGDFLTLTTKGNQSQSRVADEDQIRIYYTADWDDPIDGASGSYPRYVDEILVVGATGFAMQMVATLNEHAAVTDLGTSRTALNSADDDQAAVDTALAAANASFDTITTQIASIRGSSSEPFDLGLAAFVLARAQAGLGATALGRVTTQTALAAAQIVLGADAFVLAAAEFAKVNTHADTDASAHIGEMDDYMTGGTNGAKIPLDLIQTELDLANAALDKFDLITHGTSGAEAALDKVQTHVGAGSDSTLTALNAAAGTPYADINTALDRVNAEIDSGTLSSEKYLAIGDGLINAINTGADAPGENRRYAEAKIAMAQTHAQEAQGRFSQVQSLINIAGERTRMAETFVGEANGRISMYLGLVQEALARIQITQTYLTEGSARLAIADRFGSQADRELEIARRFTESGNGYVNEGAGYVANANAYLSQARADIEEGAGRVAVAQSYIQEGAGQLQAGQLILSEVDAYRSLGEGYLNEASRRIELEQRYILQSAGYQANSTQLIQISNLMRIEASERLARFREILADRKQTSGQHAVASNVQYL